MENLLFKITWKYNYMKAMNANTHETYAAVQTEDEALALIDNKHIKDIIKVEKIILEGFIVTKKNTSEEGPYSE